MHKNIDTIKKLESPPKVIKNLFNNNIIEKNLGSILDTSFTWSSFGIVYNINQKSFPKVTGY